MACTYAEQRKADDDHDDDDSERAQHDGRLMRGGGQ